LCECYRRLLAGVSVSRVLVAIISYIKAIEKVSWKGRNVRQDNLQLHVNVK
jgi:hypothetical protein